MKKFRYIILTLSLVIITSACHTEINERINQLKIDVSNLESTLSSINSNIAALQEVASALESNDNIVSVVDIGNGYRITFANSGTVDYMQGVDGVTPILGISKNWADGEYYWTIQMGEDGDVDWLTYLGSKCKVTSFNVQISIQNGSWCYSVDGGTSWVPFSKCTGESGSTMFNNIDTSDPYYVKFILSNGETFKMLRDGAFEQMKEFCSTASDEFEIYKTLVTNLDTSLFIKNVTECVDESGAVVGYKFTFAGNGSESTLSVYNGTDTSADVEVMISEEDDGVAYWMYRVGGTGDYEYIQIDGERLRANAATSSPIVGIQDSLGTYYLTITYGMDGKVDWMRDSEGDLVQLTNMLKFVWFSNVEVGVDSIAFTLKDSSVVTLPRIYPEDLIPSMSLAVTDTMVFSAQTQAWQYVKPNETYTITATISNYSEDISVSAMVMDGSGYVKSVTDTSAVVPIVFKTSSEISPFVSVGIYMSWGDNTVMKVVKYEAAPSTI